MRNVAAALLSLLAFVALVLALVGSPLVALLVPVLVLGAYALAVRMPVGRLLDAATSPDDDPGRGPAGILP